MSNGTQSCNPPHPRRYLIQRRIPTDPLESACSLRSYSTQRVQQALGAENDVAQIALHLPAELTPRQWMFWISFQFDGSAVLGRDPEAVEVVVGEVAVAELQ